MKKPLLLLSLCSLLTASVAVGAGSLPTIHGTVVDPSGKPAAGATVRVVSRIEVTSAVSGKGGKFSVALAAPKRAYG